MPEAQPFRRLIASGAIGYGVAFVLEGNSTLGRNESRLGKLLPAKDFCKGHIIAHYLGTFLGRQNPIHFIGALGTEPAAKNLLQDMEKANLNTRFVQQFAEASTPFCVCFFYPDKSGGSINQFPSAADRVSPEFLDRALEQLNPGPDTIVLAAPEIPIESQCHLLEAGKRAGAFTVSSVLSDQVERFQKWGGIQNTSLLAINREEAAALIGQDSETTDRSMLCQSVLDHCRKENPNIQLIVSLGEEGVFAATTENQYQAPTMAVEPVATAGAGDALLAGTLIGLFQGLPLAGRDQVETFSGKSLQCAVDLGIALASLSVTTMDTIHFGIGAKTLGQHIQNQGASLPVQLQPLFE